MQEFRSSKESDCNLSTSRLINTSTHTCMCILCITVDTNNTFMHFWGKTFCCSTKCSYFCSFLVCKHKTRLGPHMSAICITHIWLFPNNKFMTICCSQVCYLQTIPHTVNMQRPGLRKKRTAKKQLLTKWRQSNRQMLSKSIRKIRLRVTSLKTRRKLKWWVMFLGQSLFEGTWTGSKPDFASLVQI